MLLKSKSYLLVYLVIFQIISLMKLDCSYEIIFCNHRTEVVERNLIAPLELDWSIINTIQSEYNKVLGVSFKVFEIHEIREETEGLIQRFLLNYWIVISVPTSLLNKESLYLQAMKR